MQIVNDKGERLYFTEEQRKALLAAAAKAPREVRSFCSVLCYTGCRISGPTSLNVIRLYWRSAAASPVLKGNIKPCHTSSSAIKFQIWKPAYDAHLPARLGAGLKEEHLLRNTDDPNEVVLLFEAENIQKAKEFASSADLRETMQNAGVVDKPDIYFLG